MIQPRTSNLMRILFSTLVPALITVAQEVRPSIGETALYEQGLKGIQSGEFEKARLSLQTLINTYPRTLLRQEARSAIRTSWIRQGIADPDPMLLFQEAQTRATAGKYEAAMLGYQTLINLYPSSDYAGKAKRAITDIEHHRK